MMTWKPQKQQNQILRGFFGRFFLIHKENYFLKRVFLVFLIYKTFTPQFSIKKIWGISNSLITSRKYWNLSLIKFRPLLILFWVKILIPSKISQKSKYQIIKKKKKISIIPPKRDLYPRTILNLRRVKVEIMNLNEYFWRII